MVGILINMCFNNSSIDSWIKAKVKVTTLEIGVRDLLNLLVYNITLIDDQLRVAYKVLNTPESHHYFHNYKRY